MQIYMRSLGKRTDLEPVLTGKTQPWEIFRQTVFGTNELLDPGIGEELQINLHSNHICCKWYPWLLMQNWALARLVQGTQFKHELLLLFLFNLLAWLTSPRPQTVLNLNLLNYIMTANDCNDSMTLVAFSKSVSIFREAFPITRQIHYWNKETWITV